MYCLLLSWNLMRTFSGWLSGCTKCLYNGWSRRDVLQQQQQQQQRFLAPFSIFSFFLLRLLLLLTSVWFYGEKKCPHIPLRVLIRTRSKAVSWMILWKRKRAQVVVDGLLMRAKEVWILFTRCRISFRAAVRIVPPCELSALSIHCWY